MRHCNRGVCRPVNPAIPLWKPLRSLLPACLVCALLWVVHPLFAGQRGTGGLSGKQIATLQKQSLSRRQLKTLQLAMIQYTTDYEGRLPALDSQAKLRAQMKRYRLSGATLVCPFSNQPYRTNKNLAGKKLESVANPASILLFWSPRPMPDGHYLVLDASGRDRRITASELARMKRVSHVQ